MVAKKIVKTLIVCCVTDKRSVLLEGKLPRLFYCPECGKAQILNNNPYKTEKTIINIRYGYVRPITHYKCECGNYLAGSMDVTGWNKDAIEYAKKTIAAYNRGGCYYNLDVNIPSNDLYERAEKIYQQRHSK